MSDNINCASKHNFSLKTLVQAAWSIAEEPLSLENIYQQYYQNIYDLYLKFTGSPVCAEDLVQSLLLEIKNDQQALNSKAVLITRLYRIVIEHVWRYFNNRTSNAPNITLPDANLIEELANQPPIDLMGIANNSTLPVSYLSSLWLRDYQELFQPEMAQTMYAKGLIK